ncbi:DsrE family protein [Thermithiobacillus plumbiphilus]|uniref:DsrE family protein n=1 Tax=Thermithiobacillus plumbiphilus TaxID=1729899 RepID=A0ABU9D715_9PROT
MPDTPVSRTFGFILGTSPGTNNAITVERLARAALDSGHRVMIFLLDDGIYNALHCMSNKSTIKGFQQLIPRGAEIAVCSNMAKARGLVESNASAGVIYASLVYFSEMTSTCDYLLAFTL